MVSRVYSLVDSSQVSTFLISILLIVYGSFRSLNMDEECQEKEKECSGNGTGALTISSTSSSNSIQTIDSTQALFLPVGASVSLLIMFFFFDSVQVVFTICTAVLATIAFAFLLLPMCQYVMKPCTPQYKISFGCCGRFTMAELLSFSLSIALVLIWVLTGHWLLMDALAMGLCVAMIAFVRLPSLKVSCLLLSGLLVYDVFWVFFSAYIFNSNVMVKVATQPADNPIDVLSRKLHFPHAAREGPRLSLPGKLVFPSSSGSHFSMLGIGDIVMPGLLLCFVLRYDNHKKQSSNASSSGGGGCAGGDPGTPAFPGPGGIPSRMQRVSYFHCTLIGYFVGLLTATVASRIHRAAQPALLYLVPFTLLPLLTMAYIKGSQLEKREQLLGTDWPSIDPPGICWWKGGGKWQVWNKEHHNHSALFKKRHPCWNLVSTESSQIWLSTREITRIFPRHVKLCNCSILQSMCGRNVCSYKNRM
uniref:signal peptide peptidase-like 3 isoform X2 n=1 Tax=Myxine glutinosa TaxID=7769 RepID=UPI00358F93E0